MVLSHFGSHHNKITAYVICLLNNITYHEIIDQLLFTLTKIDTDVDIYKIGPNRPRGTQMVKVIPYIKKKLKVKSFMIKNTRLSILIM